MSISERLLYCTRGEGNQQSRTSYSTVVVESKSRKDRLIADRRLFLPPSASHAWRAHCDQYYYHGRSPSHLVSHQNNGCSNQDCFKSERTRKEELVRKKRRISIVPTQTLGQRSPMLQRRLPDELSSIPSAGPHTRWEGDGDYPVLQSIVLMIDQYTESQTSIHRSTDPDRCLLFARSLSVPYLACALFCCCHRCTALVAFPSRRPN